MARRSFSAGTVNRASKAQWLFAQRHNALVAIGIHHRERVPVSVCGVQRPDLDVATRDRDKVCSALLLSHEGIQKDAEVGGRLLGLATVKQSPESLVCILHPARSLRLTAIADTDLFEKYGGIAH
jgi:hypothetical protein